MTDQNIKIRKEYVQTSLLERLGLRFLRIWAPAFCVSFGTFLALSPDKWSFGALLAVFTTTLGAALTTLGKYLREEDKTLL